MSKANETFFIAVGCMDGRVQAPIKKYGIKKFDAKYKDTITEAGLVGILAAQKMNLIIESSLENKLAISVGNHHAKGIVVHGHQECAGNPVSDALHKKQIKKSVMIIKNLIRNAVPVVGVFVVRSSHGWKVEEV